MNKIRIFLTVFALVFILLGFKSVSCISLNENSVKSNIIFGFKREKIDGRIFFYKTPATTMPERGYPVLFLFHGAVQHGYNWFLGFDPWSYRQTLFTRKALENGYFVIAPSSLKPVWLGPRAWDVFSNDFNESNDLVFMQNMLAWVDSNDELLDKENVYCAGFSSGGFMCSRVGHVFGNSISAIAVHSGANADSVYLTNGPPDFDLDKTYNFSSDFPSTIIIHGAKDRFVPVEAANLFYSDLQRCEIFSKKYIYPEEGHMWLSEYEDLIFDFFDKEITDKNWVRGLHKESFL